MPSLGVLVKRRVKLLAPYLPVQLSVLLTTSSSKKQKQQSPQQFCKALNSFGEANLKSSHKLAYETFINIPLKL